MGRRPSFQAVVLGLAAMSLVGAAVVRAQIEGGDRGAAPVDSSSSFEVNGIRVDVSAKTADAARLAGWRLAQRKGWALLSQRLTGNVSALPDGTLDSLSSGIIVEQELIGPTRYIARLGVLFDRGRAGAILGVATQTLQSAPMLVLPVLYSGGAGQVFERTSPWQQAWARFRTGGGAVDYVRPVGTGPDPLLLNVGQTGRRGRGWWRTILDQYGASDILMPEARLHRMWPGGPIIGVFSAFHGPDMQRIARFSLRVEDSDALPALLDAGVKRIDEAYQRALRAGILQPDPLLSPPPAPEAETIAEDAPTTDEPLGNDTAPLTTTSSTAVQIQFDTPSPGAVTTVEANVRAIPGVQSAITTSLALGGVSVMRVAYDGDSGALRAALEARGWSVSEGGGTLRIRRAAPTVAPATPAPAAAPTPAPKGG
jgi:hypothetical protein